MRAVIDTSILVRALLKRRSTVGPVLERLRAGEYVLLYSENLLKEIIDVLRRDRFRQDVEALSALFVSKGVGLVPAEQIEECRDPNDNKILEVAVAGKADVIVTGDNDLLVLNPFRGIPIIGPAEFLARLDGTASGGRLGVG
jgi:uncharacterized protein